MSVELENKQYLYEMEYHYLNHGRTSWKEDAVNAGFETQKYLEKFHTALLENGSIPPLDEPWRLLSTGTNLPTIEARLLKIDKKRGRKESTIFAVDIIADQLKENIPRKFQPLLDWGVANGLKFIEADSRDLPDEVENLDSILSLRGSSWHIADYCAEIPKSPEIAAINLSRELETFRERLNSTGKLTLDFSGRQDPYISTWDKIKYLEEDSDFKFSEFFTPEEAPFQAGVEEYITCSPSSKPSLD